MKGFRRVAYEAANLHKAIDDLVYRIGVETGDMAPVDEAYKLKGRQSVFAHHVELFSEAVNRSAVKSGAMQYGNRLNVRLELTGWEEDDADFEPMADRPSELTS